MGQVRFRYRCSSFFAYDASRCVSVSARVHSCDIPRLHVQGSESQKPEPYRALLLDIGGTFLETSQPVPEVYARIGAKHGEFVFPVFSTD